MSESGASRDCQRDVFVLLLQLMKVVVEIEKDGRYLAEVPDIPGAMAYGSTRDEAIARVESLVLRVLAERLDHGEPSPELSNVFSVPA